MVPHRQIDWDTVQGPVHLVHTLPWDGAAGGRMASIIQETERRNKSRVRDFLRDVRLLYSLLSEIIVSTNQKTKSEVTPTVSFIESL